MYKPLTQEKTFREIEKLTSKGLDFDEALYNFALLHYIAKKTNTAADLLLDEARGDYNRIAYNKVHEHCFL